MEARWGRIEDLYARAVQLPESERAGFLERECAGDARLLEELKSLLAANERAAGFLENPPSLSLLASQEETSGYIGKRIGAFEITAAIGQGGMGAVFAARRVDAQYRQEVAIKLIKRGMDTAGVLRRFRMERQILASLEHPNIARLLDGGATDDGLPYYVMEHVAGEPVNRYMDERRLTVKERIRLFLKICSAVQFAHQKLVIHRDLKPGNILVTPDGVPKLLDFGIAKLLSGDMSEETIEETVAGVRLFTPGYASPEQVRGEMVTTASDIYSLGVVLHELLTGSRPPQAGIGDVPRPGAISRTLAADLNNILLKALAEEPVRRYPSVQHFSEDLQRYLDGLPVTARPDSFLYRAGKFVRRRRAGVAAAALLLLAIVAGIASTVWQARIAGRERARAERRFADVRALAHSFLFEFDAAIRDVEGTTSARELIVKRALEYLNSLSAEAAGDQSLQREIASALEKVSDVQGNRRMANLGDQKGALESSRKALAIRETLAAAQPNDRAIARELAASYLKTSELLWMLQQRDEALAMARKQIETARAAAGSDADSRKFLAEAFAEHGWMQVALTGDVKALIENERRAIAILEPLAQAAKEDRQARFLLQRAYGLLAGGLSEDKSSLAEAVHLYREALRISASLSSADPANAQYNKATAGSYNELGTILQYTGDLAGALENQRSALAMLERMAAADPRNMQVRRDVGVELGIVGELTIQVRGPAEGIPLLERSVSAFESLPGPPTLQIRYGKAKNQFVLAKAYERAGKRDQAKQLYGRCVPELRDLRDRGLLQGAEASLADEASTALTRLGN